MPFVAEKTEVKLTPDQIAQQAIENWPMPKVSLGDDVVFAPNPEDLANPASRKRYAAKVTKVGHRAVEVLCLLTGGVLPRMGVRHADDPALAANPQWLEEPESGVWQLADSELRIRRLQAEVDALQGTVGEMACRMTSMQSQANATAEPKRGRPSKIIQAKEDS